MKVFLTDIRNVLEAGVYLCDPLSPPPTHAARGPSLRVRSAEPLAPLLPAPSQRTQRVPTACARAAVVCVRLVVHPSIPPISSQTIHQPPHPPSPPSPSLSLNSPPRPSSSTPAPSSTRHPIALQRGPRQTPALIPHNPTTEHPLSPSGPYPSLLSRPTFLPPTRVRHSVTRREPSSSTSARPQPVLSLPEATQSHAATRPRHAAAARGAVPAPPDAAARAVTPHCAGTGREHISVVRVPRRRWHMQNRTERPYRCATGPGSSAMA